MKNDMLYFLGLKIKKWGIVLLVLLSYNLFGQTRGKVTVIKDPRIDTLIARRLALSKGQAGGGSLIVSDASTGYGYRVQFFFGSSRGEAYNAQSKFNALFPDMRTYILYNEPNFKVRGGDFRTRLEALKFMEQLRAQFPTLFIISEKINLPKSDTSQ